MKIMKSPLSALFLSAYLMALNPVSVNASILSDQDISVLSKLLGPTEFLRPGDSYFNNYTKLMLSGTLPAVELGYIKNSQIPIQGNLDEHIIISYNGFSGDLLNLDTLPCPSHGKEFTLKHVSLGDFRVCATKNGTAATLSVRAELKNPGFKNKIIIQIFNAKPEEITRFIHSLKPYKPQ